MKQALLIITLLISSCASPFIQKEEVSEVKLANYSEFLSSDYLDHLVSYEKAYLADNRKDVIQINKHSTDYLSQIVANVVKNNELFFEAEINPKFYFINSKIPFHFSLPNFTFIFSTSLLKRYIKNESMLYSLFTYELVRAEKKIYNKNLIIPTGVMSTPRILALLRITSKEKVEVHKWAFHLLSRSDIEPENYLSWLQVKNRNSIDFALQLGDVQSISREESLFKGFLIRNNFIKKRAKHKGSSRQFYSFLKQLKRR